MHTLSTTQMIKNPLGTEKIGKLLRNFTVPSIISMLAIAVYNIIDQIFIGQGVGYLGNAATSVVFPMMSLCMSVSILLGSGASAYAALKMGAGKEHLVETAFGNMLTLLTVFGLFLTIFGLMFLEPLLSAFGASEASMPYAKSYGGIILMGTLLQVWSVGLSNMARTDGAPAFAMYTILLGIVLNFILDPIYIFVFNWGVSGAAVATVQSQLLSCLLLFWYFTKKSRHMHLRTDTFKLNWDTCRQIVYLGASGFLLQIVITLTWIVMNNSLMHYGDLSSVGGDIAISSMGVILKINMILIAFSIGIGIGAQPILGFNYGAGLCQRVKKTYLTATLWATVIVFVFWVICMIFPQYIFAVFGGDNEIFADFSTKAMRIYSAVLFCVAFRVTGSSYFQATGQPVRAIISSLARSLALIPLVLILPLFFGLDGILYAGPVSDLTSVLITGVLIYGELKKLNHRMTQHASNG